MVRGPVCAAMAIGFALLVGSADAAEKQFKYVGVKQCGKCHKKELIGDQLGKWQEMKHAKAFETLKSEKALEIAKTKGLAAPPHESGECLKCHVTAYDADAALLPRKGLAQSDGVQCESCHGPGSGYRKKKVMSDHDKAVAAGMWEPGKDEKICLACHNDESPTWDPAKGFDYAARKKEIEHPIPEDVKGRYLEVEKKLKAERKARGDAVDDEGDDEEE